MRRACKTSFLCLVAALLFPLGRAAAQTVPVEVELGYRFLNVNGNEDMYRSQINEHDGFLVHSLYLSTTNFGGQTSLFDNFRISASDLGVGPAGALRFEASRTGLYRLRFSWQRTDLFSALPAFDNPFLSQSTIPVPGEQTYDRVRNVYDAELELMPGRAISPIVGYIRNHFDGPGRTTYTVGQDEFRLKQNLIDLDQEVHVGAAFHVGTINGQILQGWRKFTTDETDQLAPGAGAGNNPGPVLGVPVSVNDLTRSTKEDTNIPTTNAYVTGRFADRVKLIASYVRSKASGDTSEAEDLTGDLVSFQISRFFGGLSETASTQAEATDWRGSGRAEVRITDDLDFIAGYARDHHELDGFALVSSLYLDSVTLGGQDPRDLLKLLDANTSLDRTEKTYDASLSAHSLGPVGAHLGWSQTDQDVTVSPDASQIVVPGALGGDYSRRIRSWNGGVTFSQSGLTLGADYKKDSANDPILRTDFLDRDRWRLRAAYKAGQLLHVALNAEQTDASNDRTGIGYDGRIRQYGGDLSVTPVKNLEVRLAAAAYQADSKILIRMPQDFSTDNSIHTEDGKSYEAGVTWSMASFGINGAFGRFKNDGSFPFTINRAHLRVTYDVTKNAGFAAEWARDQYIENAADVPSLGSYNANRYGIYLRWRQ
jgi:Gram-negative porin